MFSDNNTETYPKTLDMSLKSDITCSFPRELNVYPSSKEVKQDAFGKRGLQMCGSIFKCWAGALVGMGEYTTPAAILHRYAECCLGPVLHTTNHSTFNFLLLQIGLLGSPSLT